MTLCYVPSDWKCSFFLFFCEFYSLNFSHNLIFGKISQAQIVSFSNRVEFKDCCCWQLVNYGLDYLFRTKINRYHRTSRDLKNIEPRFLTTHTRALPTNRSITIFLSENTDKLEGKKMSLNKTKLNENHHRGITIHNHSGITCSFGVTFDS